MTPAVTTLRQRNISHEVVSYEHDPAAASYGLETVDALGLDPNVAFKTLLVALSGGEHDGGLAVAVVPVSHQLDLKALARVAGAKKAAMAEPREAERATGYVLGGISPIGQKTALPTYIDESALNESSVYVSGGRRGLEIILAPSDLVAVTNGRVAPLTNQAFL